MQSVLQSPFSTLVSDKSLHNLEFLVATCLNSTRIVKNVTQHIGEHKFIVNAVPA